MPNLPSHTTPSALPSGVCSRGANAGLNPRRGLGWDFIRRRSQVAVPYGCHVGSNLTDSYGSSPVPEVCSGDLAVSAS